MSSWLPAGLWVCGCLSWIIACLLPHLVTLTAEECGNFVHTLFAMFCCSRRKQQTTSPMQMAVVKSSEDQQQYDSDDTAASTRTGDLTNDDSSDRSSLTDESEQWSGYAGTRTMKTARVRLINRTVCRPLPCFDAPPSLRYSIPATKTDRMRLMNKPLRRRLNAPPGLSLDATPGLTEPGEESTEEEHGSKVLHALALPSEAGAQQLQQQQQQQECQQQRQQKLWQQKPLHKPPQLHRSRSSPHILKGVERFSRQEWEHFLLLHVLG